MKTRIPYKFAIGVLILFLQPLLLKSQIVLKTKQCVQCYIEINHEKQTNSYRLKRFEDGHLIQNARFKISKKRSKKASTLLLDFLAIDKQLFVNTYLNNDSNWYKYAFLIDTSYERDENKLITKKNRYKNSKIIEKTVYLGDKMTFHSCINNKLDHDTFFFLNGYKAYEYDKTKDIQKITHNENGDIKTFIRDPLKKLKFAQFIEIKTGYYFAHQYWYNHYLIDDKNTSRYKLETIGKNDYRIENITQYDSHHKYFFTISKITKSDRKELDPEFENFIVLEILETEGSDTIFQCTYERDGRIKSQFFKTPYNDYRSDDWGYFQSINNHFFVQASKISFSYKSDSIRGSFNKTKDKWYGKDTLLYKGDTIVHTLTIDSHSLIYQCTSNGKHIYSGKESSTNFRPDSLTLNDLNGHPILDFIFHCHSRNYSPYYPDTLIAGHDSFWVKRTYIENNYIYHYNLIKKESNGFINLSSKDQNIDSGSMMTKTQHPSLKNTINASYQKWQIDLNYARKINSNYPYLIICNHQKIDSFELIGFDDRILLKGKGQIDLLKNNCIKMSYNGQHQIIDKQGNVLINSFNNVRPLLGNMYLMDTVDKQNMSLRYKLIDIDKGPYNGLMFDEFIAYDRYKILSGSKLTLIFNKDKITRDSTGLQSDYTTYELERYILKKQNKFGYFNQYNNTIIPAIYDQLTNYTNTSLTGKRGDFYDVHDLISNEIVTIKTNVHHSIEDSLTDIANSHPIYTPLMFDKRLYIQKINGKYGLFDFKGKALLAPEYDTIDVGMDIIWPMENTHFGFNLYYNQFIFKTLKNGKGQFLALNKNEPTPIITKYLWTINTNDSCLIFLPNGELFKVVFSPEYRFTPFSIEYFTDKNLEKKEAVYLTGKKKHLTKTITHNPNYAYANTYEDKYGIINSNDQFIMDPIYSQLYLDPEKQLLWYKLGFENEKWKLKNLNTKQDANDSFDFPYKIKAAHFIYSKNKHYGVMRSDGAVIIEPQFEKFFQLENNNSIRLFEKDTAFYLWRVGMKSTIPVNYNRLFANLRYDYSTYTIATNNRSKVFYLLNDQFEILDSFKDVYTGLNQCFFRHVFTNESIQSFVNESQKIEFLLKHLNFRGSYYTPFDPNITLIPYQYVKLPRSETIEFKIPISEPEHAPTNKLEFNHLNDISRKATDSSEHTISYFYNSEFKTLNIYFDKSYGYLVLNLENLCFGSDTLKSIIVNHYLNSKFNNIKKNKIDINQEIQWLSTRLIVHNDQFRLYMNRTEYIEIPIAELKPFMTEFWQKRF